MQTLQANLVALGDAIHSGPENRQPPEASPLIHGSVQQSSDVMEGIVYCEKCNQLNDAMSAKCCNCGNTLIHSAQTGAESEAKNQGPFLRNLFSLGGLFISLTIFEHFLSDFFAPSFGSINYVQLGCAVAFGALGTYLGIKLGDHVLGKKPA